MAVIGVVFGRNHARVYKELEQLGEAVRLVGVVDPNLDRADAVAREFGCRAFGSVEMMAGGRGDRRGADFAVRGEHLLDGIESAAAELAGHGVGAVEVGIDDADQPHGFAQLLELFVDAGVVASEDAYADDGHGNRIVSLQGGHLFGRLPAGQEIVND